MHAGGIRGVRFNFVKHLGGAPDLDRMRSIISKVRICPGMSSCTSTQKTCFNTNRCWTKYRSRLLSITWVAHPLATAWTRRLSRSLLSKLRKSENLWVKVSGAERISTAGPPFSDAVPFARACIEAAPDRVIWGTDWPHPNVKIMPNDGDLVDLIPAMAPTTELQQQLLVDNPARLFGF